MLNKVVKVVYYAGSIALGFLSIAVEKNELEKLFNEWKNEKEEELECEDDEDT